MGAFGASHKSQAVQTAEQIAEQHIASLERFARSWGLGGASGGGYSASSGNADDQNEALERFNVQLRERVRQAEQRLVSTFRAGTPGLNTRYKDKAQQIIQRWEREGGPESAKYQQAQAAYEGSTVAARHRAYGGGLSYGKNYMPQGTNQSAINVAPSQKAVDAITRAEAKLRSAEAALKKAEADQIKANVPAEKAAAKLAAFNSRTEEQQARAYEAAQRLGIGGKGPAGGSSFLPPGIQRALIPAALLAMIKPTAQFSAGMMNVAQRDDLTASQRSNISAESIPLVGGLIKSLREFGEALSGATERARQTGRNLEEQRGAIAVESTTRERLTSTQAGINLAEERVRATVAMPYSARQQFDRTTVAGRQAYQDYQRTRPLEMEATRAAREFQATSNNATFLRGKRDEAFGRLEAARQDHLRAQNRSAQLARKPANNAWFMPWTWGKSDLAERNQAAAALSITSDRLDLTNRAAQTSDSAMRQGNLDALRAETDLRRINNSLLQDQITRMKEQEARMAGNAQAMGGLSPAGRQEAVMAARMIQRHGIGNVPVEMQSMLERAGPGARRWLEARRERFAEGSPEYRELQRMGINELGTLADKRRDLDQAEGRFDVGVYAAEVRLARGTAQAMTDLIREFYDSLALDIQIVRNKIKANQQLNNANLNQ